MSDIIINGQTYEGVETIQTQNTEGGTSTFFGAEKIEEIESKITKIETFVGATGLYNRVSELFDNKKHIRVTVIPSSTTTGGGTNPYNPYEISGTRITIPIDGTTLPSSSSDSQALMFANRSYCGYVSEKNSVGEFVISITSKLSLILSSDETNGMNRVDINYQSLQYGSSYGLLVRDFKSGSGLLYSATFILEYV